MKFLHIICSLDPKRGGPPERLINLAIAGRNLQNNVDVLTLDFDYGFSRNEFGINVINLGPSISNYYFNFNYLHWLLKNLKDYDIIICHGIWQFPSLGLWLIASILKKPYFVFTHGALNPWFKYKYPLKHLKKCFYWPWAEYNVLRNAKGVLFTTTDEMQLAAKSFRLYKVNPIVVENGIERPPGSPEVYKDAFFGKIPELLGKKFFLFLGRIHPVKACDDLLEAFGLIAKENPDFYLVIAGPDDQNLIPKYKRRSEELNIADRVIWPGMLSGDIKWGALYASDCFVLPSHCENLGIVIVEAISCGTPIITTNKVNIWKEIENENIGFVSDDNVDGIRNSLSKWVKLDLQQKENYRRNAKEIFNKKFDNNIVTENFINKLKSTLN